MPIYEYQCEKTGFTFEVIFKSWKGFALLNKIQCQIHTDQHEAEKIWSTPANINIGKPTVVFKNPKTGDLLVATHDQDAPPFGYVKEELKNPIERSKFEKEAQTRKNAENEVTTEYLRSQHAQTRRNLHADLNARMSEFPNDGTREFLKESMNRRSKRKFPEKKTDVKLTVNHTDSSNLIK